MRIKSSIGSRIFDSFNVIGLCLFSVLIMLPVVNVVSASFSSEQALTKSRVSFWPVDFHYGNYEAVMENSVFWNAFLVTICVVVMGTLTNLVLTVSAAYPLSRRFLRGRKPILMGILFTMIFQAPLIPTYLLIKNLNLMDSIWALFVPMACGAFNVMLCMTFLRVNVPEELLEAAKVDGMSEYGIVAKIVVPLSMPIIMTLMLFSAVSLWNNYMLALLYITEARLRPLQLYLYQLISQGNMMEYADVIDTATSSSPIGIQMATVVISTLPIVVVYPFIQKHFIKGALLGSIKE
ncbi:carbohydrate ABC transporter permease [Paenibacillus sp. IB182496]|uniref:Carbohydrate ABC transporter permease n=1 Tax=Paenibacillus sabuli TaxID=2772509 RepID=A0A927BSX7_9BACL|nr:carbohydrate ABC transporter permease [Paenibacillus sabuli]MBD2845316.1 carbohydrate ABC transporter permease [Paenibacillus sabuli]